MPPTRSLGRPCQWGSVDSLAPNGTIRRYPRPARLCYHARVERPSEPPAQSTLVLAAVAFYGLMSIGALIAFSVADLNVADVVFGAETDTAPTHLSDGLLGVGCGLAIVLLSWTLRRFAPMQKLQREFADILGPLSSSAIAVLAVTSSIGEELLFRGALQPWIGFWPTAILFGLLHGGMTPRLWAWTVFALLAGVLLGWLADFTGSLLAPFLCHFTVNYFNLHALSNEAPDSPRLGSQRQTPWPPDDVDRDARDDGDNERDDERERDTDDDSSGRPRP